MEASAGETSGVLLSLSNDLAGAVERAGRATVAVNARQRVPSSGVHWRQGIVVTADHTIERDEDITVTLPDGRTVPATLAGRDPGTDLAVLKVQGAQWPAAEIGDAAALKVGHVVLAVARPGEHGLSASVGVVSYLGEAWRTWRGGQIDRFVRPDLTLYPGFSGGPLADGQGRVMGVNTSGLSRGGALAIPASTVNRVADQLVATGRIARGYLGIGMQPVTVPDALKSKLGLAASGGLVVVSVQAGGPAEKAGMLIGDILVALDGKPVADTDDVQALLDPERVGKAIAATVIRGGEVAALTVTVGERPQRGE
jgi:S1-C subfamily serine protease